jgi:DNA-binding protein H-NS
MEQWRDYPATMKSTNEASMKLETMTEEELKAKIDAANEELARRSQEKRGEIVRQIYDLAQSIGATVRIEDGKVTSITKAVSNKRGSVPIKYRNPKNPQEVWSGRGIKPKWMQRELDEGASLDLFKVA